MAINYKEKHGNHTGRFDLGACAVLLGICAIGALIFALVKKSDSFFIALGDAFIVEALFCFALAWVGYLKKDGIRILPPKKNGNAEKPESWKDRVPRMDQEPPSFSPLPGPEGPGSAEYNKLVEAEAKLRHRILYGENSVEGATSEARKEPGRFEQF